MVWPLGTKSDAGSVREPQPAALRLLGGNFQPLAPPDPLDPFVVDDPAGGRSQKFRDLPIAIAAILTGELNDLLLDRGFAIAKCITRARRAIPEILSDLENELTAMAREAITELYDLFRDLDRRISSFDKKIACVFRGNEDCQRIARIKGVGPKTATAIVAAVGDGSEFKNGRHLAAWVGLVPRQHSSGERKVLMGISKRGNKHLRSLLVHGARAVVRTAPNKTDPNNQWVNQLRERRGFNRATVAVANKNARMIWAVLRTGEPYRVAF